MVKPNKQNIHVELDQLNEKETVAVADYISQILSSRKARAKENQSTDDLIVSLSDAYENKRARQVFEWERARRQTSYRAA